MFSRRICFNFSPLFCFRNMSKNEPKSKSHVVRTHRVSTRREQLLQHDVVFSRKLAYCGHPATSTSTWSSFFARLTCKLLEFSGHGVPWFLFAGSQVMTAIRRENIEFWTNVFYGTVLMRKKNSTFWQFFLCSLGLVVDIAFVGIAKSVFRRPRPVYATQANHHRVNPDQFSFPSGHATRVVMLAVIFCSRWTTDLWTNVRLLD